jgi:Cytochrome c554 and c-prime
MFKTSLAALAALVLTSIPAIAADYPDNKQADIAKNSTYVGSNSCVTCHGDIHANWEKTRHTQKARKGPALGKEFSSSVYAWVQRDWDKLDSHMIIDQKDKNTNYVTVRKYKLEEVGYVIGQIRKQRYAVYYDGAPVDAYLQTTMDGGISWTTDKSQVVKFPGNKERAGWKFLTLEMKPKDGEFNKNSYGEFYSWQERCIGCHVTGFDVKAWNNAKAEFVAGKRADLKDIFVVDTRVGCESCHGPGAVHTKAPSKGNIINPTKITNVEARKMVCEQCHTRATKNLHAKGANDLRGYRIGDKYSDHAEYVRPNWGKGNRAVSIDGKGRRDHQMDMDIRLSATIKGPGSVHAKMACFDCHDSHNIGIGKASKVLKLSAKDTCAKCHADKAEAYLKVLDGTKGWAKYGYGDWANEGGRAYPRQHMFNKDAQGRSYGITPDKYHWALKKDGDAKKQDDWQAIWPWEKEAYEKKGLKVAVGATPWN